MVLEENFKTNHHIQIDFDSNSFYSYLEVVFDEPKLFRCNTPIVAIIIHRLVLTQDIFNAPSTDSLPLLVKNAYFKLIDVYLATR